MKIFVLLFCCGLALATEPQSDANLIVQTVQGRIKGAILKTRLGNDIFAFRGIRYGEAPIGQRRFKQAEPAKSHLDVFDATEDGPSCPTMVHDNHPRVMSEDCLRLNVYSNALPQLPEDLSNSSNAETVAQQPKKDVVVFIHPCVFSMWSGTSYDFGPQYLLDRDIVLVTINHRLGSLGFMSTGDERAPGNAGLKDQVLALRWIQQNIKNFGGNPDSVTLMGYSHGAWSIQLHLVSPMSEGLFHRAISMSGAATSHNPLPNQQTYLAKMQAEAIGCPIDTLDNMFQCLYSKPTEDYINSIHNIYMAENPFGHGHFVWQPVIEPASYGKDSEEVPFITAQIVDLIIEKKAHFVPIIIGVTEDEFGGDVIPIEEQAKSGNSSMYEDFNIRWEEMAAKILRYNPATVSQKVSADFKKLYLKGENVGIGRYQGLAEMFADRMIFPTHRFERLMATYSSRPVFNYMFAYPGCESFAKWSDGRHFGVSHHDDLLLLFKVGDFPAVCKKDVPALERLTGMIENFAKTDRPITVNSPDYSNVIWEPSTASSPKYLKIAKELSMESGFIHAERMNKWDELFPLSPMGSQDDSIPSQGEIEHQHHQHGQHQQHDHQHQDGNHGQHVQRNQDGQQQRQGQQNQDGNQGQHGDQIHH